MVKSLTFKVLTLTLITVLIGVGLVVSYFLTTQNRDLLREREAGVAQQTEILHESIKNNMLVGTASIARGLLSDLKEVQSIREIAVFRANGIEAFSDNETIELVNQALGAEPSAPSEPQEPQVNEYSDAQSADSGTAPSQAAPLVDQSELLYAAVRTLSRQISTYDMEDGRELVYYVPLRNESPACTKCHSVALSPDPNVRGVIRITSSLGDVDRQIRQNTLASLGIWVAIVAILTIAISFSLDRLVLKPIKVIGEVAGEVERGNLEAQVRVRSRDEIGHLADQINHMIVGLNERLKLTKFVSQATLQQVVSGSELALGGEKYQLTVLFSDMRDFTTYAEQHDPQDVIKVLNLYMQRQAGIILKAGGDVDQFVGDEILGVFRSETMVEDAVRAALDIRAAVNDLNATQELNIHVGIGIHTGLMIEGNIGAQGDIERLQRTVIGDAVNVGSRICDVASPDEILLSQAAYDLVRAKSRVGTARTVQVKGKSQPLTVYPVLGLSGHSSA
jgi:adenylate cyclase